MKSKLLLCGPLLFALLLPSVGQAQTSNKILKGIQGVKLLIEFPGTEGTECGITLEGLRQAVMFPAISTNLGFRSGPPYYYVNVTTIKGVNICSSNVRIELYYLSKVELPNYPSGILADVVLWHSNYVLQSGKTRHMKDVQNIIEDLTKKFLIDWNLDNK